MLRVALFAALVAHTSSFWYPAWGQSPRIRTQSRADQNNRPNLKDTQIGTDGRPAVVDVRKEDVAESKRKDDTKDFRERWTFDLTIVSCIISFFLLVVGGGGVWAALRTLNQIKRQADTMDAQFIEASKSSKTATELAQRTAEAAFQTALQTRRSVDSLIASERAWVLVCPMQAGALIPISPGAVSPHNVFRFTLTNTGKTAARLMKFQSGGLLTKAEQPMPETPHYEPHQVGSFGGDAVLIERHYGAVFAPGQPEDMAIGINTRFDSEKLEQIGRGEWIFRIFGRIEYFDFAEKPRAVQFCYRYVVERDSEGNPVHWMLDGPAAYNTHD